MIASFFASMRSGIMENRENIKGKLLLSAQYHFTTLAHRISSCNEI